MSDLAETLQQEHVTIRASLDVVGALIDALDRGVTPPAEDLDAILEFMEDFTDKDHRAKEDALFTELTRVSGASVRPLLHALEVEHAESRRIVAAMRSLASWVAAGDPRATQDFEMYLRSYRMRTQDHIREETRELLPLLDSAARSGAQGSLDHVVDRAAARGAGARDPGVYRELIRGLATKYPSRTRGPALVVRVLPAH